MSTTKLIFALFILLALPFSAARASASVLSAAPSKDKDSITLPFDSANNLIIISATLNGAGPFRFVLDTGASHSIIKTELARSLGLTSSSTIDLDAGSKTTTKADVLQVAEVQIDGFSLLKQQFFSATFPPSYPFDGFLGAGVFERLTVSIDFRRSLITFTRAGAFHYHGAGIRAALDFRKGVIPQVRAELDGNQAWFKLDTGYNGSLALFAEFIEEHDLLRKYAPQKSTAGGETLAGTVGESPTAEIRGFKLGTLTLDNVSTAFFLEKGGSNAMYAGAIGTELLKRFNVVIDYHAKRLILEGGSPHTKAAASEKSNSL